MQYEQKLNQLNNDHAEELARERQENEGKLSQLIKSNEKAKKKFESEVMAMQRAVYARDNFTPVSDRELGENFESLSHDIKHLAMRTWKSDQRIWSHEIVKRVASHPILMRRELLQDSIWWILYEMIFCSPFRIFGEEGRLLEKQWSDSFERGTESDDGTFSWPSPTLQTERWRYETVKQCHAALKEPTSELDPRARVKKGFKEARDSVIAAIEDAIMDVAKIDERVTSDIERLVKKAINIWLECGIQRCRIVISMPSSGRNSEEQKLKLVNGPGLDLVLAPLVTRYGTGDGLDLKKISIVSGCTSEVQRYPNK
ncbi:uncharacterized protein PV09_00958 [Verruconis gallopava]|uniref:Uncharacterized protein n=1 Tax=Verruconis gallopava TaxID=253628 RepID=A0A0D1Z504_9PEZI|nr:uncharacterized protein PV09_00958 [Verruconis gallopava]KIW08012.1 hypothetical protein PV09_00958 [Verruconis gallopava]